jgi:hypothetical protein
MDGILVEKNIALRMSVAQETGSLMFIGDPHQGCKVLFFILMRPPERICIRD